MTSIQCFLMFLSIRGSCSRVKQFAPVAVVAAQMDPQPIHWACRGGRVEMVTVLKDGPEFPGQGDNVCPMPFVYVSSFTWFICSLTNVRAWMFQLQIIQTYKPECA